MADVAGRVAELRSEAESAIAAATSAADLEELRVRYLGRKAELTAILLGLSKIEDRARPVFVPRPGSRSRRPAGTPTT